MPQCKVNSEAKGQRLESQWDRLPLTMMNSKLLEFRKRQRTKKEHSNPRKFDVIHNISENSHTEPLNENPQHRSSVEKSVTPSPRYEIRLSPFGTDVSQVGGGGVLLFGTGNPTILFLFSFSSYYNYVRLFGGLLRSDGGVFLLGACTYADMYL